MIVTVMMTVLIFFAMMVCLGFLAFSTGYLFAQFSDYCAKKSMPVLSATLLAMFFVSGFIYDLGSYEIESLQLEIARAITSSTEVTLR